MPQWLIEYHLELMEMEMDMEDEIEQYFLDWEYWG